MLTFVQWLNETSLSVYIRESDYPFPIIETIHVLALGLSVGVIMWLDLRLLGITMRKEPVREVIERIHALAIPGFLAMFISGFLLCLAMPLRAYTSIWFQIKIVMLVLAGLNVLYFHKWVMRSVDEWDRQAVPWRAKMAGAFSLTFWILIIFVGRWFAYF